MKKLLRAIIAFWAARKLGGSLGCLGTIILFFVIFWLLGWIF